VCLARARAGDAGPDAGADALERALAELAHARGLDGCQNRVALLEARARLERARRARARGADAAADLAAVLARGESLPATLPDATAWQAVLAEARALAAGRERG
jgi:hypothetical protein